MPRVFAIWTAISLVLSIVVAVGPRASLADEGGGNRTSPPINGPLRPSRNPNYFQDASGTPLILCGSQTWNTLQDWGTDGTVRPLAFDAFVGFLKSHRHNFTLLWCTELPRFHGLPSTETSSPDFTVSPFPWQRTGPGMATDGKLKFDLTRFDQAYFDRLRARVQALNHAGIYVGVYFFTGEWLLRFRCATDGYPFSGPNNINAVDDGYRGGSAATAVSSVTMTAPNEITHFQDAYVKKTIDTLNDLPNVLWIVSEEAPAKSTWWNNHLIALAREYEEGKRFQHPIGYGALEKPPDSLLYDSDADWVAPSAWVSPVRSCGSGAPACKVNVNDSDHSYFGMWNDTPQKNRNYAWQNFMTGNQVLFMDPYLVYYPRQKRNLCITPEHGIGREARPALGEFPEQSGIHPAIFAEAQSGERHPQERALDNKALPGPDAAGWSGVPGLRSCRRLIQGRSLGDAGVANARGGMVRPGDGQDNFSAPDRRWISVALVQSAVQRRCGVVSGGHRGAQVKR